MVSKYTPNKGHALNKGCNESHAVQVGMTIRGTNAVDCLNCLPGEY